MERCRATEQEDEGRVAHHPLDGEGDEHGDEGHDEAGQPDIAMAPVFTMSVRVAAMGRKNAR